MTEFGNAEDVGADGGDIHEGPVEGIPVAFYQGIGTVFYKEKDDTGKINDDK